jgi:hypothetical protein
MLSRKLRRAAVVLAGCGVVVTVAAVAALGASTAAEPNAVTTWNGIATGTLVQIPGPDGGAPPALQISMGMVQGAVYDAVNAITPKHRRPYLLNRRFSARASVNAAVATAAYGVLAHIVSTAPERAPFPARATLLQSLGDSYTDVLDDIEDSPFKRQGIDAGQAAADAMIAARADDGRFGATQWKGTVTDPSLSEPGHWQPHLPNGTIALDPTPWVGAVTPFLLQSPDQFQTAGPKALTSTEYAAEFNEVKGIGGNGTTTISSRTSTQTHNAIFWQSMGGPALLWNGVARSLVEDPANGIDVVESALLFAELNLSGADAAISCWNDKYHFDFWRPWHAIRQADRDNNPLTAQDATWTPLLTAPYPDHVSGHNCLDGAEVRVLQFFFGNDIRFGVTSNTPQQGIETRFFDHFSEPLAEIIDARIWAGLHFRSADTQGQQLGRNVADYMVDNYFQRVGRG